MVFLKKLGKAIAGGLLGIVYLLWRPVTHLIVTAAVSFGLSMSLKLGLDIDFNFWKIVVLWYGLYFFYLHTRNNLKLS